MSHHVGNVIPICNQSLAAGTLLDSCRRVIWKTQLAPPQIQTAFQNAAKSENCTCLRNEFFKFLSGFYVAVGALGQDLLPWKKFLSGLLFLVLKLEKKIKHNKLPLSGGLR